MRAKRELDEVGKIKKEAKVYNGLSETRIAAYRTGVLGRSEKFGQRAKLKRTEEKKRLESNRI